MKKTLVLAAIAVFLAAGICLADEKVSSGCQIPSPAHKVARAAKVVALKGTVEVKQAGKDAKWVPAKVGTMLSQGDQIKTASGSSATLNVDGDGQAAIVEVKPQTSMTMSRLGVTANQEKQTLLGLSIGNILIKAKKLQGAAKFEVETPTAVLGVRGTEFEVTVSTKE